MRVLVTGSGGRVGGLLVKTLQERGDWVRGLDVGEARPEAAPNDMVVAACSTWRP